MSCHTICSTPASTPTSAPAHSHSSAPSRTGSETLPVYGAGTLTTVFTIVTDAFSNSARPFSVVTAAMPGVENVTPCEAMIVPTIVPPPARLIVAALPTCQNTFLACAPLIRITWRGAPGPPTVKVLAI
jgi:hypothetical protein